MEYINFSSANCKNCYKCLRSCPVKSIRIKNQQAKIVEERCIACGHCLAICPQNARKIVSDLSHVKKAIKEKKKIIASIAPSFPGYFPNIEEGKIISFLKKIGFFIIEETAIGAEIVTDLYKEFIESSSQENFITTCCPSVNYLVQKYYPSLTKYMLPYVSPMIAHGKLLKKLYGEDSFVVFIGPCVSKKLEANEYEGVVDAVLTFDEIDTWIREEKVNLADLSSLPIDRGASIRGGSFPTCGGVTNGCSKEIENRGMEIINVSGIDECMEIFKEISNGDIDGVCVEVNSCKGSCIGGPEMIKDEAGFYIRQKKVKAYIRSKDKNMLWHPPIIQEPEIYSKAFNNMEICTNKPNDEQLSNIMRSMGKFEPSDELNCGVCGYNTCKEKAEAVFQGMAETDMCLNFMRNKAERITNVIFENSPSVIILIDEELNIIELNPTAEETFSTKAEFIKGKPISILMNNSDFIKVKESKINILGKKVSYPQYNGIFIENILYLEKQNIILVTMSNIMEIEKNKRDLLRVREQTLNAAQEVIDKQMRVAQEIASLLGETTAETKLTLTKLKKMVIGNEDGDLL